MWWTERPRSGTVGNWTHHVSHKTESCTVSDLHCLWCCTVPTSVEDVSFTQVLVTELGSEIPALHGTAWLADPKDRCALEDTHPLTRAGWLLRFKSSEVTRRWCHFAPRFCDLGFIPGFMSTEREGVQVSCLILCAYCPILLAIHLWMCIYRYPEMGFPQWYRRKSNKGMNTKWAYIMKPLSNQTVTLIVRYNTFVYLSC